MTPQSAVLSPLYSTPVGRDNGRTTWRLVAPLRYLYAPEKHTITVHEGFITDYASIPRLPLIWWVMSDHGHTAAVIHDYLCRDPATPRAYADAVFLDALLITGVARWRARLMWAAVRSYATIRGL